MSFDDYGEITSVLVSRGGDIVGTCSLAGPGCGAPKAGRSFYTD
jgi:hypothetical protein